MASEAEVERVGSLPLSLTVAEVAALLRVSRTTVYDLAHRWLATGGEDGLPCYRIGRCIRVPRRAVVDLLGRGSDGQSPAA